MPIHNGKATIVIKTPGEEQCCSVESIKNGALELWLCILKHTNIRMVRDTIAAEKYCLDNNSKKKQTCETFMVTRSTKVACKGNFQKGSIAITAHADVCGLKQHQCFEIAK